MQKQHTVFLMERQNQYANRQELQPTTETEMEILSTQKLQLMDVRLSITKSAVNCMMLKRF